MNPKDESMLTYASRHRKFASRWALELDPTLAQFILSYPVKNDIYHFKEVIPITTGPGGSSICF